MTGGRGLRWHVPVGFALFLTGIVALLTRRWMQDGNFPPAVPAFAIVLIVVLGGVVLWFGAAVRRYQRGNKADLNAIRATRTLALAQAAALTGAALIGLYAGQALGLAPDWDLQTSKRLLWGYAGGLLAAGWLVGAGLVAQSWCRIPPREGETSRDAKPPA
jgi:hypothetical protein